jgi:hypothetical protein
MPAKASQQRAIKPPPPIIDHRMAGNDLFAAYLAVTKREFWNSPKIKETISGKGIAAANPETQIAVAHRAIAHLAKFARTLRKEDINYHGRAGYSEACVELLRFLFRRKLPYSESMLAEIAELAGAFPHLDLHRLPYLEGLVGIVERHATEHGISGRMAKALRRLKDRLISNAPESRLSGRIGRILKRAAPLTKRNSNALQGRSTDIDEPSPFTYQRLSVIYVPPDLNIHDSVPQFRSDSADPNWKQLEYLNQLFRNCSTDPELRWDRTYWRGSLLTHRPAARPGLLRVSMAAAAILEHRSIPDKFDDPDPHGHNFSNVKVACMILVRDLIKRSRRIAAADLADLAFSASHYPGEFAWASELVALLESCLANFQFSKHEYLSVLRLRERLARDLAHHNRQFVDTLDDLLGIEGCVGLEPGDRWADRALEQLSKLKQASLRDWQKLIEQAAKAEGSTPTGKWEKHANELIKNVGEKSLMQHMLIWLPMAGEKRQNPLGIPIAGRDATIMADRNADVLKGLVWCLARFDNEEVASALGDLAAACFKMIPGHGARCVKVGNACIYVLSGMKGNHGARQLARLRWTVKFRAARKLLDKAFSSVANRSGLTVAELDEISVPGFGLDSNSLSQEQLGDYKAELAVEGSHGARLTIFNKEGKPLPSVPGTVKAKHGEQLAALQKDLADIPKTLAAQRERLDQLFRSQRTWQFSTWRERYLEHPLLAALARRLIWQFESGRKSVSAMWHAGRIVDVDGRPIRQLKDDTTVRLWHPLGCKPETVLAWREFLESQEVIQPFKQAHREIYILTDAERETRVYSNRFAAHIIKQHQFNALCQQRGWDYKMLVMYDGGEPGRAILRLPDWNLRAEFWVEQADDENYAENSGAFLYLSTDQVRFHRGDETEPLPLADVPPLIFSEVMRDLDLFVGVASVGNDPTWLDGGPAQYRGYWNDYSFGELNASAETRKAILERVIPRLKIAECCSFEGRFLVVQGDLRTYKIHLGSGNVLMKPNDQYLCIVPSRTATLNQTSQVFLPFEGDQTLSIILSKAFLLANDSKISDPTIERQILKK